MRFPANPFKLRVQILAPSRLEFLSLLHQSMIRSFLHSFDPPTASPVSGPTVDLEVSAIEDAGIREVLQTPGAAYGAWSILDALLTPTGPGTPFVFREPLGQARGQSRAFRPIWSFRRSCLSRAALQSLNFRSSWQSYHRLGPAQTGQAQAPVARRLARLDRLRLGSIVPDGR